MTLEEIRALADIVTISGDVWAWWMATAGVSEYDIRNAIRNATRKDEKGYTVVWGPAMDGREVMLSLNETAVMTVNT